MRAEIRVRIEVGTRVILGTLRASGPVLLLTFKT